MEGIDGGREILETDNWESLRGYGANGEDDKNDYVVSCMNEKQLFYTT